MCKIIVLEPNQTVPFEKLENAVLNNPHGWGYMLVDQTAKKMEVKTFLDPDPKGTNPETVQKFIEKNKDIQRVIHLRWMTEGKINLDNVQPFSSYYSESRQVYFCHNGTLYDFKDKSNEKSDSRMFNELVIQPLLLRMHGDKGPADITDSVVMNVLNKYFGTMVHNKGILVSNDIGFSLLNEKEWKRVKLGEHEILSSNDEYWHELKRGPVFEQRKREKETKESTFRKDDVSLGGKTWPLTKLEELSFSPKKLLGENPGMIMEDMNLHESEGVIALSNMTEREFRYIIDKSPAEAAALMILISSELRRAFDAYKDLEERKDKASKIIADLKKSQLQAAA